jgi:opacity protein-like surface antigen
MKKMTALAAGLLLLIPALAFSDSFQFRLGYFMPGAPANVLTNPNSLWAIEFSQMSFTKSDFNAITWGGGYEFFLNKNVSLCFVLDAYRHQEGGYYLDWVGTSFDEGEFALPYEIYDGYDIVHYFNVSNVPIQFSVKLLPLGRRAKFAPFIGGGGTWSFWKVQLDGDMVDFSDPWIYTDPDLGDIDIYPITTVFGREKGMSWGWHAFGGFQIPIGFRTTIEAEARYQWLKAKFNDWFVGFDDFDLSGLQVTVGLSYWF